MATTESFDLDDERRINLTQSTRERIVSEMTKNGKIPEDKEDRQLLLAALDGLDRTTLGKARIKTDSQSNKSNQETAGLVAQLLSRVVPGSIPLAINSNVKAPVLDADFTVSVVPGECEIGAEEITYDTFVSKMEEA